jgi:hypothetical protein
MGKVAPVEIVYAVTMHSNPNPTVVVGNETADIISRKSVVISWIVAKMCDVLSIHTV